MPADKSKPSKTADLAVAARALQMRRLSPPLFDDSLALVMCSPFWHAVLTNRVLTWLVVDRILGKLNPILPTIYVRARFGEDQIEKAVAQGVHQMVIIGAGYDTFAMRRPDLSPPLTVYELDLEATQREKQRRMQKAGIPVPAHTHYVTVDLETQDLFEVLVRAGFDVTRPAIFSWFGVTYYLTHEAIRHTLQTIAGQAAPGSHILFDYMSEIEYTPAPWKPLQQGCSDFVAKRGESWISGFDPQHMETFLQELGFTQIENLKPTDVEERYMHNYPGVSYPAFVGVCRAVSRPAQSPDT